MREDVDLESCRFVPQSEITFRGTSDPAANALADLAIAAFGDSDVSSDDGDYSPIRGCASRRGTLSVPAFVACARLIAEPGRVPSPQCVADELLERGIFPERGVPRALIAARLRGGSARQRERARELLGARAAERRAQRAARRREVRVDLAEAASSWPAPAPAVGRLCGLLRAAAAPLGGVLPRWPSPPAIFSFFVYSTAAALLGTVLPALGADLLPSAVLIGAGAAAHAAAALSHPGDPNSPRALTYPGAGRVCDPCGAPKPPRAAHCTRCRRCVARFDHHCLWLGNDVGERNHCAFIAMLAGQVPFAVLCVARGGAALLLVASGAPGAGVLLLAAALYILLTGCVGIAWALPLLLYHLHGAARGETTLDDIRGGGVRWGRWGPAAGWRTQRTAAAQRPPPLEVRSPYDEGLPVNLALFLLPWTLRRRLLSRTRDWRQD
eukprot:TRINITY_DN2595_c0_g2_i1.p2 TRINITY_DN2595_c0_g2~~TRINITY_DN2595_c0_g2_i1.p2  ORF type:complete len:458 (+),score=105.85 TRINITY_DN2595_c0_g2_i1:56-1375(+)